MRKENLKGKKIYGNVEKKFSLRKWNEESRVTNLSEKVKMKMEYMCEKK